MISFDEARRRVFDGCPLIDPQPMAIREALGCVTAGDVIARELIPPFDNTSLDGYAVRAADTVAAPTRLRVVDELRAGQAPHRPIASGEAIRIMTGAPMPPGADAIVMVEETTTEGIDRDVVLIGSSVEVNDGVRAAGSDVRPGDLVIASGTELGPNHLGLLASLGDATVDCYRRLRVGVISSGDELVADGSPLRPGQIRDANSELLVALVAQANAVPVDLGIVIDDEAALTHAFVEGARRCDALITSGGVSMGDYDLVKVVLDRLGEMQWMQIAIRPAKPFAFGVLKDGERSVPVFGLPGNPVSSLVSFELFARPALRKMMGHRDPLRPRALAIADERIARGRPDEKTHFIRVRATRDRDGRLHVRSSGEQGSHQLANSASANALLALRDGEQARAGDEVQVVLIG